MTLTIPPAREMPSGSTPRANSPASAGVFYHLPNPFCFAGPLADDEVETVAAIGQADAMASTSESGLDELTFAYVTSGVRAALQVETLRLQGHVRITSC